jgi:hypothetical protein
MPNLGSVVRLVRLPPGALHALTTVATVATAVTAAMRVVVILLLGVIAAIAAIVVIVAIVAARVREATIMAARVTTIPPLCLVLLLGINPFKVAPRQLTAAIPDTLAMVVHLQEWDRRLVFLRTLSAHLLDSLEILMP